LKRKLNELHDDITDVISWLKVWQWCHFLLASYRR